MPSRNDSGRHAPLDKRWQAKQTKGVGDLRARSPNTFRQLLLRTSKVLEQLAVSCSLFKRIQLCTMKVFEESISQQIRVINVANDRRNGRKTRVLRRAQTSFAHNELEALGVAGLLPNNHRLQNADLANAVDKFTELIFIKEGTRLTRISINAVHSELAELCIGDRIHSGDATVVARRRIFCDYINIRLRG